MVTWELDPPSYSRSGIALYLDLAARTGFQYSEDEALHAAVQAWNQIQGSLQLDLEYLTAVVPFPLVFLMPQGQALLLFGAYACAISQKFNEAAPSTRAQFNAQFGLGSSEGASLGGRIDFPRTFLSRHLQLRELINAANRFLARESSTLDIQSQIVLKLFTSASKLLASCDLFIRKYGYLRSSEFFHPIAKHSKYIAEKLERKKWDDISEFFLLPS